MDGERQRCHFVQDMTRYLILFGTVCLLLKTGYLEDSVRVDLGLADSAPNIARLPVYIDHHWSQWPFCEYHFLSP